MQVKQAEIQEGEVDSFPEVPGLISAYHRNPAFLGASVSVQSFCGFHLAFALVHTTPLSKETREQEGELQNLDTTIRHRTPKC